jgi:hypothetical protein
LLLKYSSFPGVSFGHGKFERFDLSNEWRLSEPCADASPPWRGRGGFLYRLQNPLRFLPSNVSIQFAISLTLFLYASLIKL